MTIRTISLSIALSALAFSAGTASAQGVLSTAIQKAQNAKAASDAHTAAMQRTDAPASASAPAPAQKPATPKAAPAAPKATAATQAPAAKGKAVALKPATDSTKRDTLSPPPTIYREMFAYSPDGRRDPFVSLLTTNDLRPAMSDLRLTGVLFDHSGRGNSLATLRDMTTNAQYRVGIGSALGRMRVSAIRTETVVFTIEEFGTTRRDSLVLRDSTNKARAK